ncbi:MAG: DUF2804 domain-containing protein [Christensenellaceae bacterium]|jgi:hypothetical protein|nr:DUF2804 domain-containing protein [Christensenellaceae bacterium]
MKRTMHEVTKEQPLLENGTIKEPGWAKNPVWQYSRAAITAPKTRIKEWDCYIVTNSKYSFSAIISDCAVCGLITADIVSFENKKYHSQPKITLFPMGKYNMPESSLHGNIKRKIGRGESEFIVDGKTRYLKGAFPKFTRNNENLIFDIKLDEVCPDTMTIATPFENPNRFYYNRKINLMRVSGSVKLGQNEIVFDPNDSFSTLDWGRGVWPYKCTWYWSSLNAQLEDGDLFGWNLGYGFGNTTAASENVLYYNGTAHKLDDVTFEIPIKGRSVDFMSKWHILSSDGRLDVYLEPIVDKINPLNLGIIAMIGHQVFGKFSGFAILDDGSKIELKGLIGFAEKVCNKW